MLFVHISIKFCLLNLSVFWFQLIHPNATIVCKFVCHGIIRHMFVYVWGTMPQPSCFIAHWFPLERLLGVTTESVCSLSVGASGSCLRGHRVALWRAVCVIYWWLHSREVKTYTQSQSMVPVKTKNSLLLHVLSSSFHFPFLSPVYSISYLLDFFNMLAFLTRISTKHKTTKLFKNILWSWRKQFQNKKWLVTP